MIEVKNITKIYQLGDEKIHALDRVSLRIEDGDFLAVVGPSGSGKSTLANIVGGLDVPDRGSVVVNGDDIAHLNDKALSTYRNQQIGFIFQTFNLQGTYTALENVMIPLVFAGMPLAKRKKRATNCLQAVGLGRRAKHKPNQLSGGERQRVCIARALANKPAVIIADEPTGNLDSKKGMEIIKILTDLNRQSNITLIVITHDTGVAKQAKRMITIKDGRIS